MSRQLPLVILELINFLTLVFNAEGQTLQNIARGKPATQYDYDIGYGIYPASNAVDGDSSNCGTIDSTTITLSGYSSNPWWQVDLGDLYTIERVEVYGRADGHSPEQLLGFRLFLSTFSLTNTTNVQPVYTGITTQSIYKITNLHTTARFCRLEVPPGHRTQDGPIVLCEVKIFGTAAESLVQIIRPNFTTSMSSTFPNWNAPRAIDNNPSHAADACNCCSATNGDTMSWWQINLGRKYRISVIKVYGRSDNNLAQSQNLSLVISNTSMTSIHQGTPLLPNGYSEQLHMYSIRLKDSVVFQYFLVGRSTSAVMTICEVEMFKAECTDKQYGPACQECGHCRGTVRCHQQTGVCLQGCADGYMPTDQYCTTACTPNTYGPNCTSQCGHCTTESQCNNVNGICSNGCVNGYTGVTCKSECPGGTYGLNCTHSCGHCSGTTVCDIINGNCPSGCESGYNGRKCDDECSYGTYGLNCANSCGHCSGTKTCDKSNGNCLAGCESGYRGSKCDTGCSATKFGPNCMYVCHCSHGSECDDANGKCPGECDIGWRGSNCSIECPDETYGLNCTMSCGHCSGTDVCNKTNGNCPAECTSGYRGLKCDTECQDGRYGQGCVQVCGHCSDTAVCDKTSGKCPAGCASGYKGSTCDTGCSATKFGPNCMYDCHCSHGSECDDASGKCPGTCDIGWGGSNCSIDLNIITRQKNVSATQSSVFDYTCTADKAIDQRQQQSGQKLCDTCSVMTDSRNPWWQIDLHNRTLVGYIRIFGRTDGGGGGQGANLSIYISNTTMGNLSEGSYVGTYSVNNEHVVTVSLNDSRVLQFLKIGRHTTSYMTICEVKLYAAECETGKFGDLCSTTCHCSDKQPCNDITGVCQTRGCDPGWKGDSCDKSCSHGKFGKGCGNYCHCYNDIGCNNVNGTCPNHKCAAGWQGFSCSSACNYRTFGQDCNTTCHCFNNNTCTATSGSCPNQMCDPGWQGDTCSNVCPQGKFGGKCDGLCHCYNNTECNNVNGTCLARRCAPGWQGLNCSIECGHSTFGQDCNKICHCYDDADCNNVNGSCPNNRCAPGWQGDTCSEACPHGKYGGKCSSVCHCTNNTECDHVNGTCFVRRCAPGWQESSCSAVCKHRTFGQNCSSICHCYNNTNCKATTGICPNHRCDPGWRGETCRQACRFSTFGENCTKSCHCGGNSSCHNEDGACLLLGVGCEDGWEGLSCSLAKAEDSAFPVAGVVGGSVGAVLVILIVVFVYKKRIAGKTKDSRHSNDFSNIQDIPLRSKTPSKPMVQTNNTYGGTPAADSGGAEYYSFTNLVSGIKIHDLWAYIRAKTADDNDFFDKEFQKLPAGLQYSTKVANNPKHAGKNRYKEMYAYDHTRVSLTTESATDSEYINACFVDGYGHLKKFIASQGPTKAMIGDFWRMVWQQKSEKIVMLTNLIEMGTQKCLQYWPETGQECDFGNINIKITSIDTFGDYVIRTLEVNKDNAKSRTIRQFHFKAWPDKDVPDNAWCLVNFWRAVDTNARAGAVPIVVHCSAGVGRTGTFIAMDNLVAQARAEGCVRPLQIVETLRSQRVNMVQTKNQYVYLHEALAEALLVGTHFLCMRHFENVYRFMIQKERRGASKSRIEEQFSLIMKGVETMPSLQPTPSPEYGNIETVLSESDAYRPQLKKRGSNFIQHLGAYFLPNYEDKNTFLVTLSPTDEHMEEFWSLIEEQHIVTVIMLTSTSNHSYKASLKLGSKSGGKPVDKFAVNLVQEKARKGFTEKSFTFRDRNHEDDDYLTTIKQFEYTAWKEGYETPGDTKSMLDLLDAVQHWQPALAESKPILVHCESAFLRSGLVCVLLNEIQRIKKQDGHINIVETVMTMKQRNKDVVHSHEQYKYCYDVLAEYARQTEVYQNL